jgi:hypothetical protein
VPKRMQAFDLQGEVGVQGNANLSLHLPIASAIWPIRLASGAWLSRT